MKKITGVVTALFTLCASTAAFADTSEQNRFSQTAEVDTPGSINVIELARNMHCPTHDGYGVSVMNMSAAGLYQSFNVRFGNADYTEDYGYRTFIDAASLQGTSPQLQAFIAAHECAHHTLGHTYKAYDMGFIPQDRHHRYERQADCEAIRRIALDYGYSGRETVAAIFDELAAVNQQIILNLPIEAEEQAVLLNAFPERSADRKADGLSCTLY